MAEDASKIFSLAFFWLSMLIVHCCSEKPQARADIKHMGEKQNMLTDLFSFCFLKRKVFHNQ